jgi:hypothetical protein
MRSRLLLFTTLATAGYAYAQTGLHGIVKDPQGRPIAEVQVRLFSKEDALSNTQTSDSGAYRFDATPDGMLLLEARKEGFRTAAVNVEVQRGSMKEVNIALELAGVNQSIVVTAAGAAQVDAEISKAVTVIDNEEIQNRNALSLADILRFSPGLQVRNGGGIGQNTSVRLRGLRAEAAASVKIRPSVFAASAPMLRRSWWTACVFAMPLPRRPMPALSSPR